MYVLIWLNRQCSFIQLSIFLIAIIWSCPEKNIPNIENHYFILLACSLPTNLRQGTREEMPLLFIFIFFMYTNTSNLVGSISKQLKDIFSQELISPWCQSKVFPELTNLNSLRRKIARFISIFANTILFNLTTKHSFDCFMKKMFSRYPATGTSHIITATKFKPGRENSPCHTVLTMGTNMWNLVHLLDLKFM